MEFTRCEDKAIQEAIESKNETNIVELLDLQLAMVGGGMGDVTLS